MTHAEAVKIIRLMLLGAQKSRSIGRENLGDEPFTLELLEVLQPFLYGDGCVVPTLARLLQESEAGAPVSGSDLHNLVYIATRLEPSIAVCAINYGDVYRGNLIPEEADMAWIGQTYYPEA